MENEKLITAVEASLRESLSAMVHACRALDEDENEAPMHYDKADLGNASYLFGRVLVVMGCERGMVASDDDIMNIIEDIKGLVLKYTGLKITK